MTLIPALGHRRFLLGRILSLILILSLHDCTFVGGEKVETCWNIFEGSTPNYPNGNGDAAEGWSVIRPNIFSIAADDDAAVASTPFQDEDGIYRVGGAGK